MWTLETTNASTRFCWRWHIHTYNGKPAYNGHGSESIEWPNKIECAVYVKSPWNNVVTRSLPLALFIHSYLHSATQTHTLNNISFHFNKQNGDMCTHTHTRPLANAQTINILCLTPDFHSMNSIYSSRCHRVSATHFSCRMHRNQALNLCGIQFY